MLLKAKKHNLQFRPHFKTHQSAEIGRWFMDYGVSKITVSSVEMAEYFSDKGWENITIAFPVNIPELDKIDILAKKIKLNLLVANYESVKFINNVLTNKVSIFIKIDTGYHRSGISADDFKQIGQTIKEIKKGKHLFCGFLTHSGNTYDAKNTREILKIHSDSKEKLVLLKKHFEKKSKNIIVSIGDTPSCTLAENFNGVNEIRPGNFVFFDLMQEKLGVCSYEQIAVSMACPVVDKQPERNEIVIYGGAVHFSKEYIFDEKGNKIFGRVVKLNSESWSNPLNNAYLKSMSQEHGIIKLEKEDFDKIKIASIIGILPVHSCLSSNNMNSYLDFEGTGISKFNYPQNLREVL